MSRLFRAANAVFAGLFLIAPLGLAQSQNPLAKEDPYILFLTMVRHWDDRAKALEAEGKTKDAAELRDVEIKKAGLTPHEGEVVHKFAESYHRTMTEHDQRAGALMKSGVPVPQMQEQRDALVRSQIHSFEVALGPAGMRKIQAFMAPKEDKRLPLIALLGGVPPEMGVSKNPAEGAIRTSWSFMDQRIGQGEPVLLRLLAMSSLAEPAVLNLGPDAMGALNITITAPSGRLISLLPFRGSIQDTVVEIAPGKTLQQNFVLNQLHDFPELGEYKVRVSLKNPIRTGERTLPVAESEVKFTVAPRDEVALKQRYDQLIKAALNQNNSPARTSAIDILTAQRDPAVVSYLKRLLVAEHASEKASAALAQIADRQ
jgi:hypothetical protein